MSKMFEALEKAGGEIAGLNGSMAETQPLAAGHVNGIAGGVPLDALAVDSEIATAQIHVLANTPVMPFDDTHSEAVEQYKIIRTKIAQHPDQPRSIAISSPDPGDGKTINSLNIAAVLSLKSDVNVLLVDADLRRSSISKLLGLPASPGLAGVLDGSCSLEKAIFRIEQYPNLYVLPAGAASVRPTELLDSPQWRLLAKVFRREFRFTIMDAPPIGLVADYDLIQESCERVIVVVRPDHTNRTLCMKALKAVPQTKMLGVVVNAAEKWFLLKNSSYYYGYSYYGRDSK